MHTQDQKTEEAQKIDWLSDDGEQEDFDELPIPEISLPLGRWTTLPIVNACANFSLPDPETTQWDPVSLRSRYEEIISHLPTRHSPSQLFPKPRPKQLEDLIQSESESAIMDEIRDDDDDDILIPFFLSLPRDQPYLLPEISSTPPPPAYDPLALLESSSSSVLLTVNTKPIHPPLLSQQPIGYLKPSVVRALLEDNEKMGSIKCQKCWSFIGTTEREEEEREAEEKQKKEEEEESRSNRISFRDRPGSRRSSATGSGFGLSRTISRRGSQSASANASIPNSVPSSPSPISAHLPSSGGIAAISPLMPASPHLASMITKASSTRSQVSPQQNGFTTTSSPGSNDFFRDTRDPCDPRGIVAMAFADWINGFEFVTSPSGEDALIYTSPESLVGRESMELRNEHIDRVVRTWKAQGRFSEVLGGWRDEFYTVYAPARRHAEDHPTDSGTVFGGGETAFKMERAACALFGFATFGVHLNGWVVDDEGRKKLWVPKRARTKQTWPGYYDNTVAGGITHGQTPIAVMLRECAEEASLPPSFVRKHVKSAGVVSYVHRTPSGWIQPEHEFIYDLEWPSATFARNPTIPIPMTNPADGEVESFELMSLDEVLQKLFDGEFKPNCGLIIVDWMIRHGILSNEGDAKYSEVCRRLRGSLGVPGM